MHEHHSATGTTANPIRWLRTLGAAAMLIASSATADAQDELPYEVGGPLAGVRLPLMPTQHGEPAGHPGLFLQAGEQPSPTRWPDLELNPGSVERWHAYWTKYCPVRPLFDRQTQLANWSAPQLADAAGMSTERYAAPLTNRGRSTDKQWAPAPVVRATVDSPSFELDLGELEAGMYVVRVVAAVQTEAIHDFRSPLFMRMTVNDGLKGERTTYRQRLGYVDEFYSIAEFYFHAPKQARYAAELAVDAGSEVDLLVQSISLDDVLAGSARRGLKTRSSLFPVEAAHLAQAVDRSAAPTGRNVVLSQEERWQRDAALWRSLLPINSQGGGMFNPSGPAPVALFTKLIQPGAAGKSVEEIEAEHGAWTTPWNRYYGPLEYDVNDERWSAFLVNEKLGLTYSIEDMQLGRPLPDPFPYKDDGAGLYHADPDDRERGLVYCPIAQEVSRRYANFPGLMANRIERYQKNGDIESVRDAGLMLVRFAYQYPAMDAANYLSNVAHSQNRQGLDGRARHRMTEAYIYDHYANYVDPILYNYDKLYEYLSRDEDLARSVSRFVPWVRTPEDVTRLIDNYLVEMTAKRIMRYHYYTDPTALADVATIAGDSEATTPWMQWLFTKTTTYPLPPAGVQDMLVTNHDRYGAGLSRWSTYYVQFGGAHSAGTIAASLQGYLESGGDPRYDISRYSPKAHAAPDWAIRIMMGGLDFVRIGSVTGPDKPPAFTLPALKEASAWGWRWTQQPRFAWLLKHLVGRTTQTDAQWAQIEQAAAQTPRAPWLDNRSRYLDTWAGILETGHQHDDHRFRRAVSVRTGVRYTAGPGDALDLNVVAHGLPMAPPLGQRGGYNVPDAHHTRIFNTVEVNGQDHNAHGGAAALADLPGARYLRTWSVPPRDATLFTRQTALIDVNEGEGSQPTTPAQQTLTETLPADVRTANSYVFDVFRVAGGKVHTYGFHGPVDDAFNWNAENVTPVEHVETRELLHDTEANYLGLFRLSPQRKLAGDAPPHFQATWRMNRYEEGNKGSEARQMGLNYDADSPRKFTRLHVIGATDARVLSAPIVTRQYGYDWTHVMVQRRAAPDEGELDSTFAAVIEPYAGEPFIQSVEQVNVADNEADALRAVALRVLTEDGGTDLVFADGRPEQTRRVDELRISGEHAVYATDAQGLRLVTLVGGTLLQGPDVTLKVDRRAWAGRVVDVDYDAQEIHLDTAWPAAARGGRVFQIGTGDRQTTYTSAAAADSDGATLRLDAGADLYRAQVLEVDAEQNVLRCAIPYPAADRTGRNRKLVASNEAGTAFWRMDSTRDGGFTPTDSSVSVTEIHAALADGPLLLWEYGVGDAVRQSTSAYLRRIEPGVYEFFADASAELTLRARAMTVLANHTNAAVRQADGQTTLHWQADHTAGPVRLRIEW